MSNASTRGVNIDRLAAVLSARKVMPVTAHRESHDRWMSALWYGYGMADSGAYQGLTLDHAQQFAEEQAHAAVEFYVHESVVGLDSILSAWSKFCERNGIRKS